MNHPLLCEVIDFSDVNDNRNFRFESEAGRGRNGEDGLLELLSYGPTGVAPFQVGYVENQKYEETEIKQIDNVGKCEEYIDHQLVQETKYTSYAYHHHHHQQQQQQQQQSMSQHQLNIRQGQKGTDGESATSPSGESDPSSLLLSSFESPDDELSSIEVTDWIGTLRNNNLDEEPIYIYHSVPIIDNPLYDGGRVLPPIPMPYGSITTTEDDKVSIPVEPTSPQSLQSMRAFRYVAGLSTEDIVRADDEGDTILHLAILKEETSLVDALIMRFDRNQIMSHVINLRNASSQTPLCMAVYSNQATVVAQLIALGADVNVQVEVAQQPPTGGTRRHYRVLHFAVERGEEWRRTLAELLRAGNIDADAFNSEGRSPLHVAIEAHGRTNSKKQLIDSRNIIQDLINSGANLNIQDKQSGRTPLHYVLEKKDLKFLGWYLDMASSSSDRSSFRPNWRPSDCDRLLLVGPGAAQSNIMHEILNARTKSGSSSLEIALGLTMDQKKKEEILELLIRYGAQNVGVKKNKKRAL